MKKGTTLIWEILKVLLITLLSVSATDLAADPPSGDSFVIDGDSPGSTEGRPGGELRRYCGKRDHTYCSEACRKYFDDAYHRCREDCLGDRCVEKREAKKDPDVEKAQKSEDSRFCIELESEKCVQQCDSQGDSNRKLRCRRACLSDRCPNALPSDSSREALNPGSVACDRCKDSVKETCKQACIGGLAAGKGSFNGLMGFGCNIACAQAQCASKCPTIPLP